MMESSTGSLRGEHAGIFQTRAGPTYFYIVNVHTFTYVPSNE